MPSIHHLLTINAPAERVFEAITTPDGLCSWWTTKAAGQPSLDAEYQFFFSKDYDWRAKVVEVTPPSQISWQMTNADTDWTPTQLHFQLTEGEDGMTTVRFAHTSWEKINDHFRRTSFCWATYLETLRKVLEKG
ncbi:MAG: SRPBCC family protein [Lewinella sp.]|mgnify:CR=1 FL=1|jgi:uncharacterized protein YndB with AHSA1/START domain|uniref:SRPBCC family protein n=1 Tax=Lewinella sp. TaxID=2004506 RepID=UPI003D6BC4AE